MKTEKIRTFEIKGRRLWTNADGPMWMHDPCDVGDLVELEGNIWIITGTERGNNLHPYDEANDRADYLAGPYFSDPLYHNPFQAELNQLRGV